MHYHCNETENLTIIQSLESQVLRWFRDSAVVSSHRTCVVSVGRESSHCERGSGRRWDGERLRGERGRAGESVTSERSILLSNGRRRPESTTSLSPGTASNISGAPGGAIGNYVGEYKQNKYHDDQLASFWSCKC